MLEFIEHCLEAMVEMEKPSQEGWPSTALSVAYGHRRARPWPGLCPRASCGSVTAVRVYAPVGALKTIRPFLRGSKDCGTGSPSGFLLADMASHGSGTAVRVYAPVGVLKTIRPLLWFSKDCGTGSPSGFLLTDAASCRSRAAVRVYVRLAH